MTEDTRARARALAKELGDCVSNYGSDWETAEAEEMLLQFVEAIEQPLRDQIDTLEDQARRLIDEAVTAQARVHQLEQELAHERFTRSR